MYRVRQATKNNGASQRLAPLITIIDVLGPQLLTHHSAEAASLVALAAADAAVLVNDMGLSRLTKDTLYRTGPFAQPATDTFLGVDREAHETAAAMSRAALLHDVGLILVAEVPQRAEDRIRRGLAETAQGSA